MLVRAARCRHSFPMLYARTAAELTGPHVCPVQHSCRVESTVLLLSDAQKRALLPEDVGRRPRTCHWGESGLIDMHLAEILPDRLFCRALVARRSVWCTGIMFVRFYVLWVLRQLEDTGQLEC